MSKFGRAIERLRPIAGASHLHFPPYQMRCNISVILGANAEPRFNEPCNRHYNHGVTKRWLCHSTAPGVPPSSDVLEKPQKDPPAAGVEGVPGVLHGAEKMVIVYTCSVCETRSARTISKVAYSQGVVLVRCPGCRNLHLVADHLGYFEDSGSGGVDIEALMKQRNEAVRRGTITAGSDAFVTELTPDDAAVFASPTKSVSLKTGEVVSEEYTRRSTDAIAGAFSVGTAPQLADSVSASAAVREADRSS